MYCMQSTIHKLVRTSDIIFTNLFLFYFFEAQKNTNNSSKIIKMDAIAF